MVSNCSENEYKEIDLLLKQSKHYKGIIVFADSVWFTTKKQYTIEIELRNGIYVIEYFKSRHEYEFDYCGYFDEVIDSIKQHYVYLELSDKPKYEQLSLF